jgi:chitinase
MTPRRLLGLTLVVGVSLSAHSEGAELDAGAPARVVIGYVFPRDGMIDPSGIAVDPLTHVNYAFANIEKGRVVEGSRHDAANLKALTCLRRRRPDLKILTSVGGWLWSGGFSDAALTPKARDRFVKSIVEFVGRHDLDGIDIDWEYPGLPGNDNVHRPEDKQNFTAVMAEIRSALDHAGAKAGRRYLLTFAAGTNAAFLEHVEMEKLQASVDFVNLMTYDFRQGSDHLAGHHANLYENPADDKHLSTDGAVRAFLAAGTPPSKLVVGVPFYGHGWSEVEDKDHGLYQPGQPLSGMELRYGSLAGLVGRDGWERFWDEQAQAPFLWNAGRRAFVTYDDPESLRLKCRYIRDHGLAGAMFWEYYADPTGALLGTLATELGVSPR